MPPTRMVIERAPNLFSLIGMVESDDCLPVISDHEFTYYRVHTKPHYILYRTATSGWGAAAPDPNDSRPVFDGRQR